MRTMDWYEIRKNLVTGLFFGALFGWMPCMVLKGPLAITIVNLWALGCFALMGMVGLAMGMGACEYNYDDSEW